MSQIKLQGGGLILTRKEQANAFNFGWHQWSGVCGDWSMQGASVSQTFTTGVKVLGRHLEATHQRVGENEVKSFSRVAKKKRTKKQKKKQQR